MRQFVVSLDFLNKAIHHQIFSLHKFFIDINQLFLTKNSAFEFTNLNEAKTIIANISKLLKEIMLELEIKITS